MRFEKFSLRDKTLRRVSKGKGEMTYKILIDKKTAINWIKAELVNLPSATRYLHVTEHLNFVDASLESCVEISQITNLFDGSARRKIDNTYKRKKDAERMLNRINTLSAYQQGKDGSSHLYSSLGRVVEV